MDGRHTSSCLSSWRVAPLPLRALPHSSSTVYPGHGICFVRNDSKVGSVPSRLPLARAVLCCLIRGVCGCHVQVFRFCRSKCHNNFKMKRNPRKVRWTKAFRKSAGKEMAVDATLDFERKRNRVAKYDRELVGTTLRAMRRVTEIKQKREARFYKERMMASKQVQKVADRKELKESIDLIGVPAEKKLAVQEKMAMREKVAEESAGVSMEEDA
eukprot:SAG25_NODE_2880_length_1337_cov_11.130223_1_plen_213_part_00